MPTLDRRLLAWSDDDSDAEEAPATSGRRDLAADHGYYDRCAAPSLVDDVLVPSDGGGGVVHAGKPPPVLGTRKACAAAAGLVAAGCLCAYLAWRFRAAS